MLSYSEAQFAKSGNLSSGYTTYCCMAMHTYGWQGVFEKRINRREGQTLSDDYAKYILKK